MQQDVLFSDKALSAAPLLGATPRFSSQFMQQIPQSTKAGHARAEMLDFHPDHVEYVCPTWTRPPLPLFDDARALLVTDSILTNKQPSVSTNDLSEKISERKMHIQQEALDAQTEIIARQGKMIEIMQAAILRLQVNVAELQNSAGLAAGKRKQDDELYKLEYMRKLMNLKEHSKKQLEHIQQESQLSFDANVQTSQKANTASDIDTQMLRYMQQLVSSQQTKESELLNTIHKMQPTRDKVTRQNLLQQDQDLIPFSQLLQAAHESAQTSFSVAAAHADAGPAKRQRGVNLYNLQPPQSMPTAQTHADN